MLDYNRGCTRAVLCIRKLAEREAASYFLDVLVPDNMYFCLLLLLAPTLGDGNASTAGIEIDI